MVDIILKKRSKLIEINFYKWYYLCVTEMIMKVGVVSLLKQDVYNFIKNHPNGVSVKEIYSNFTHIPQGTISNRLSNMVDEGILERPKRGGYKVNDFCYWISKYSFE